MKKIKSYLEANRTRKELRELQLPGRTYFKNGHRALQEPICEPTRTIKWYEYGRIIE